ncbi:MAG: transposase [Agrobacterium sp.]|nr:transposase [Agrobacterium sp.]
MAIFILDQTHIVVPDNKNYKDAVYMRVDEFGHRYDTYGMSEEQKAALPLHPCYALSELLHIGKDDRCFMIAGYQLGPGNTDDVEQGKLLVRDFVDAVGQDVMKLLIVDRGFIDGAFIDLVCKDIKSDVLVPLKKNMDLYLAAKRRVESADWKGVWTPYRTYVKKVLLIRKMSPLLKTTTVFGEIAPPSFMCQ